VDGYPIAGSRTPGSDRLGRVATTVLPGLVVVALGLRAGSYFAGTTALGVVIGLVGVVVVLQLAPRPFAGVGTGAVVAVGCLGLLAVESLASIAWSHSAARGLIESDRFLLYAVLALLGAAAARAPGRLRAAITGVTGGIVVLAAIGVFTRLLPSVLPTARPYEPARLSYPLTYWNGLGVLLAAGMLLCAGLTCSSRSSRLVRALSAAAVPLLAVGLYLTLARGAIVALGFGLVALVVLGRSWRLLTGGLAVLPPTALALVVAYGQDVVASDRYTSAAGVSQGRHLTVVLVICMVVAGLLRLAMEPVERRLEGRRPRWRPTRRARLGAAAAALLVVVVAAIALGAPHAVSEGARKFADSSSVSDSRSRLTSVGNNGRIAHWTVALDTFRAHPLKGTGAGTYAVEWARQRQTNLSVLHAHSAYLGALSDLGLVGGLLLIGGVLALLVGLARQARGPDALLGAAAFAGALTWALHTGIDWDLELPATGAWVFLVGGMALARPAAGAVVDRPPAAGSPTGAVRSASPPVGRPLSGTIRLAAGVAVLVLAVTPALVAVSQVHIGAGVTALKHGNCPRAISESLSATGTLGLRPEPYETLGFCDVRLGNPKLGVQMMQRAVDRDPDWWEYRYGLALVQGAAGLDPRPALAQARRLNPREGLPRDFAAALKGAKGPRAWRQAALTARLP
jgi:O-antigen ligase/polysaccharide polymerase Wzy-like membrane protein